MRRIKPEFLPPGRTLQWLGFVVAAGFAAASVVVGIEAIKARKLARDTQEQILDLRHKIAVEQDRLRASAPPPPCLEDAQRLVRIASMPVDAILRSIERVRIPGVRALALEVLSESAQVRLEIEANDLGQVSQVLEELNAGLDAPRWNWAATRSELAPRPRVVATLDSSWRGFKP